MVEDISGENDDVEKFAACCDEKEQIEARLKNQGIGGDERRKLEYRLDFLKKQMANLMTRLS